MKCIALLSHYFERRVVAISSERSTFLIDFESKHFKVTSDSSLFFIKNGRRDWLVLKQIPTQTDHFSVFRTKTFIGPRRLLESEARINGEKTKKELKGRRLKQKEIGGTETPEEEEED